MINKKSNKGYVEMMPGVRLKTRSYGEKTLLAEFLLEKGKVVPRHQHPYEQTGYLVSGALQFSIGAETFTVHPGDSWCIAANLEHGVTIEEDAVVVEVFSPVREDYLPENLKP